jgi:replication-associated recombination protein RarA
MKLMTQRGYDFYEVASALQKSIRRGDVKLAGYMALELFPRYSEYCWKRLLTISAEDCYGVVTKEIMALYQAFHVINEGKKGDGLKGRIFISKAVILLCQCKHNRDADLLSNYIYDKKYDVSDEEIERMFLEVRQEKVVIPEYVYDVHTRKGKMMGKTKRDFFIEEDAALANKQLSIFDIKL